MSIPETTILPMNSDRIQKGGKDLDRYIRDLVLKLQNNYSDVAEAINGQFRRDTDIGNHQWKPVIKDSVTDTTTFNYTHQTGWVLRQGVLVDVWFDVQWGSESGTIGGNMILELPYQVAITNNKPFVGVLQSSVFTYTGGTEAVINAVSDTFTAEIWNVGDTFTTANQASVAAGHLIGNIRYVGKGIERS